MSAKYRKIKFRNNVISIIIDSRLQLANASDLVYFFSQNAIVKYLMVKKYQRKAVRIPEFSDDDECCRKRGKTYEIANIKVYLTSWSVFTSSRIERK